MPFPEVQHRAREPGLVCVSGYPSHWAAIESIASKIGCTAETLRKWVRQGERDSGAWRGPTTAEQPSSSASRNSSAPVGVPAPRDASA